MREHFFFGQVLTLSLRGFGERSEPGLSRNDEDLLFGMLQTFLTHNPYFFFRCPVKAQHLASAENKCYADDWVGLWV